MAEIVCSFGIGVASGEGRPDLNVPLFEPDQESRAPVVVEHAVIIAINAITNLYKSYV
jgi:hypothetical protein